MSLAKSQLPVFIFYSGMILMAASIPLSVFGMSVSQFVMMAGWLAERNYRQRVELFFKNRPAMLWVGLYVIHLAGALWSSDTAYLLKDLRIKLPLLILPFMLASFPRIQLHHVIIALKVFVVAVAVSCLISIGVLTRLIPVENPITDIRQISIFISHIRLSLCVVFSVFLLLWFITDHFKKKRYVPALADLMLVAGFLVFLFILESMTGFLIFLATAFILTIKFLLKPGYRTTGAALIFLFSASVFAAAYYLNQLNRELSAPFNYSKIDRNEKTAAGSDYFHCFDCPDSENGTPVYIYISEPELEPAWNQRSRLRYDGKDNMGHELKYTLFRYLASKGLRKDSAGVYSLSDEDIQAIENGVPNYRYRNMGNLNIRLHKTVMEYRKYRQGGNPSGSSLLQRLEYWKTGWLIFKDHLLTGTGTGDVQQAFDKKYRETGSQLVERWRLRAHNQYLTFALTFGIFGLMYFIILIAYPLFTGLQNFYPFLCFWLIVLFSMITEDTLETQAGVSFCVFFASVFLGLKDKISPNRKDR